MDRKELLQQEMQALLLYPNRFDVIKKLKTRTLTVLQKALIRLKETAISMDIVNDIKNKNTFDDSFKDLENQVLNAAANVFNDIEINIAHLLHVPDHHSLASFLEFFCSFEAPDKEISDPNTLLESLKKQHEEQLVVMAMLRQELKDCESMEPLIGIADQLFDIEKRMSLLEVDENVRNELVEVIENGDYEFINSL